MVEEDKYKSIINQKCSSCYKNDWCMLSPYQRVEECLGPFMDVKDNLRKFTEYCEKEKKPSPDLERIVKDIILNQYLRNKKLFDDW